MKAILICLILIFISEIAFSENVDSSAIKQYEENAIMLQSNGWSRTFVKGGNRVKMGAGFRNLKTEYEKSSTAALGEFKEFKKCNMKAGIWSGVYAVGLIAGAAVIEATPIGGLVAMAAAFIPYGISIKNLIKGQNHFQKSIWLHNRDVLTKEK